MRTYAFVVGALVLLTFSTSSVNAEGPSAMDQLLQRFGLLPDDVRETADGLLRSDEGGAPTAPARPKGGSSTLGTIFLVASEPFAIASKTLIQIGLLLVGGLFDGFAEGGKTMGDAASTVGNHPLESSAIALASLAIAGLAGGVGLLWQRYGSLGAIPLYSRIAKSDLLENQMRGQIFELIKNNPGINVSEIARRLEIAWGTATHHLHKLRHEKMVGVRIVSNQKCFFPNGGTYTPHEMDVMSAVKHPTARQIAEFLVKGGASSHGDIAAALGVSPALVSFHARKLVDNGIVTRHREGRHTIFTALEPNLDPTPRPATAH